jgi:acyl carrier protein
LNVLAVPSRSEILDDVIAILSEQMGVALSGSIDEATLMFADLGLASIDAVVLSESLQKHYPRPLPFQELLADVGRKSERDLSIGELVAFLCDHL